MGIRVSIVEDDDRFRQGVAVLIDGTNGFRCVSSHATAEEALRCIPHLEPDVVLMDIHLPGMSGIDCVRKLKGIMPRLLVVMLSSYEDQDLIFLALGAGATGFLNKQTPPARLLDSISDVVMGGAPMSASIARKVIQSFHERKSSRPAAECLSKREHEILEQLVRGKYYKEIAESLAISFETVHTHVRNIYQKLNVRSRSEAIARYREM